MNLEHYHIFIVEGREQLEICAQFKADLQAKGKARFAWCKAQGGKEIIHRGGSLIGILADPKAEVVAGWKPIDKDGWRFPPNKSYVPDRRLKAGKAISREMESHDSPTSSGLAGKLGSRVTNLQYIGSQCHLMDSQCYEEGEHFILLVPRLKDKPVPEYPGCRLLKLSEFHAIKEAKEGTHA